MLLKEFAQLTGFTPTEEYFNEFIHPAYMRSDKDKQAWCKEWLKFGGIQAAYNWMSGLAANAISQAERNKEAYAKRSDAYNELFHRFQILKQTLKALAEA